MPIDGPAGNLAGVVATVSIVATVVHTLSGHDPRHPRFRALGPREQEKESLIN
jgi:hypothetical protein